MKTEALWKTSFRIFKPRVFPCILTIFEIILTSYKNYKLKCLFIITRGVIWFQLSLLLCTGRNRASGYSSRAPSFQKPLGQIAVMPH